VQIAWSPIPGSRWATGMASTAHSAQALSGHAKLMSLAKPDALFMHASRASGDEVTDEVIDGRSRWFSTAENRCMRRRVF